MEYRIFNSTLRRSEITHAFNLVMALSHAAQAQSHFPTHAELRQRPTWQDFVKAIALDSHTVDHLWQSGLRAEAGPRAALVGAQRLGDSETKRRAVRRLHRWGL